MHECMSCAALPGIHRVPRSVSHAATHAETRNVLQLLSHTASILGHPEHKLGLLLHALQGADSAGGQVGRQRGTEAVAQPRQALVVYNVSIPRTEATNGRKGVAYGGRKLLSALHDSVRQ